MTLGIYSRPAMSRACGHRASYRHLMRYELVHGMPVALPQILPPELMEGLRCFVRKVLSHSGEMLRQKVDSQHDQIAQQWPAPELLKEHMIRVVELHKKLNGEQLLGDLRSGRLTSNARLGLLKLCAEKACSESLHLEPKGGDRYGFSDFLTVRAVYAALVQGILAAGKCRICEAEGDFERRV
ncbi:hypothetical protein [Rhizobium laguerreae]|uniref:hypothetical protein n=1 Tax=Rhizobium laguerreae TaxID=1076926 RepID=UPI001C903232|nr:hypothetical protein [Rhizobium laguerreae]MBY3225730.1 hypothetical protein [Rhizobium laguerreae]